MTSNDDELWRQPALAVLAAYPFEVATLARVTQGLVNLTVAVTARDGARYALQRLHPVFGPGVNANLDLVTAHLAGHGLLTPRLVRTREGALAVEAADGRWRVTTWVDGQAYDFLRGASQAEAAGALLARFHAAAADYVGPLLAERPPVHEFARHRAHLASALATAEGHALAAPVAAAAAQLDALRAAHPHPVATPPRLVHGDPKISNLLFDPRGTRALCMVDLDTLARMALPLELGDALRSWCNPRREDDPQASFDLELFAAALSGYARGARDFVRADEVEALLPATLEIHLELAARFLADALEERYFGWDAARYPTRGAHNLARARGQLAAAASLAGRYDAAVTLVARAFA